MTEQSEDRVKVRRVARLNPSGSEVSNLSADTKVSFVPLDGFGTKGTIEYRDEENLEDVRKGYTYFREGDIAIAKITPSFENGKGAICKDLMNGIGFGTTELHVLRPSNKIDTKFLWYSLRTKRFFGEAKAAMRGVAGQQRVPSEFLANYEIPEYRIPRQRAIADFLDREVEIIDNLIERVGRLSELLEQKRKAELSAVMTGGLNESVDTKNPDMEWIEEIPAHWEIVKLKYLSSVQTGVTKGGYNDNKNLVSVPYLRVANVQDGHLDLSKVKTIDIPSTEVENYLLEEGDVLMNEGGDYDKLGRGTVWTGDINPCIHQNHVFCVRPKERKYSDWISKLTESAHLKQYFINNSKQSTNLASISVSDVKETPIFLPPEEERKEILEYIGDLEEVISEVNESAEKVIQLLKEKRQALITAAVTGQIDVTEAQSGEQEVLQ